MFRKATLILLVLAICSVAFAAEPAATVSGKITAIGENSITVAVDGDLPAWVKKNAPVKFGAGMGKVLDVTDGVVTIKTKKASQMKSGDAITFQKGKAMAGC